MGASSGLTNGRVQVKDVTVFETDSTTTQYSGEESSGDLVIGPSNVI
jgi:hypothetical protein